MDLQRHSSGQSGTYRFGSARVNGRTRVVAVTGAVQHDKFKPVSPVQNAFGGGTLDGLFVVLEMDTLPMSPPVTFQFPTAASRELTIGETAETLSGLFVVSSELQNNDSIVFFLDSTAKKWPLQYRANAVGNNVVDVSGSGRFALRAEGDRVELGEEGNSGKTRRLGGQDGGGRPYPDLELHVELTSRRTARGVIILCDRRLERSGPLHMQAIRPATFGMAITGKFEATKAELGLSESPADANDMVTIGWWAPGRPAPEGAAVERASTPGSRAPAAPGDP